MTKHEGFRNKHMGMGLTLAPKNKMKKFIKTHPHHSLLYAVGGILISSILAMGGLTWASSSHLYAESGQNSSTAAAAGVSKALAGAAGTAAQQKPATSTAQPPAQTGAKTTAPAASTPAQSTGAASSQAAPSAVAASSSALRGLSLYVDPARASLPAPLNSSPVGQWFGGWTPDIQGAVNQTVSAASARGTVPTLVAYNIPNRDCGSYSAGGASGGDSYRSWIRSFAAGIGQRQAIVILEPDALAQITCLDSAGQAARYGLINDAVSVLASTTRAFVYLDAGNSSWISASDMAPRLQRAGIANATGFSLNVSGFETTATSTSYGNTLSSKVGGKHFVIDTGRNGNGPATGSGENWCNPSGRALGAQPTTSVGGNTDAYLWVKVPGESDGTCNGGPSAGTYWSDYANALINNRH